MLLKKKLSHRPVEVVGSYLYLGVTFSARSGKFLMTHVAKDILTIGCASLSLLQRRCHPAYFQELWTKEWLFNSFVTHFLMYVSMVWAARLPPLIWAQLEGPLVMILSHQL